MKKVGIINGPISSVIAALGHTDTIAIADAGLPIPSTTKRIDLALTNGVPTLLDTLKVVLSEMHIEKAIVADEILSVSPTMHEEIKKIVRIQVGLLSKRLDENKITLELNQFEVVIIHLSNDLWRPMF